MGHRMKRMERVWIIGAGAIGSAMAALQVLAGRAEAMLVGSSTHWQAVRDQGLRLSLSGDTPQTVRIPTCAPSDMPALGRADLVLLTGKLGDLEQTLSRIADRVPTETGVIALQNGLGVATYVGNLLGRPVDRGLVIFGANAPQPGSLHLYPGRIRWVRSAVTEAAHALFDEITIGESRFTSELIDAAAGAEWRKLAVNCLANPLAALLGEPNARLGAPDLDPAKEAILSEVRAVAQAEGVEMDLTVADFNRYMAGPTGGNTASMRTDILRGRPTEIDFINGAVVAKGREHGIPTPVNTLVVGLIKALSGHE